MAPPRDQHAKSGTATSHAGPLLTAALILTPGMIWGSSFFFIAEALEVMEPQGITFARTTIGALTLMCFPSARRRIDGPDRWRARWLGAIWIAIPMSMFPFAEQHITSALAGLLNVAIPVLTALIAVAFTRVLPTTSTVRALGVGLLGASLIAVPTMSEGGNQAWGVALVLLALVFYGVSLNLVGPLQQKYGAPRIVLRAVAFSAVLTAPTGAAAVWNANWTVPSVLAILALGAGGTGAANVLAATAAGRLSPGQASAIGFVIPSFALLLGMVVRHEQVPAVSIAGSAICMIGAWLLARSRPRPSQGAPSTA